MNFDSGGCRKVRFSEFELHEFDRALMFKPVVEARNLLDIYLTSSFQWKHIFQLIR